MKKVIFSILAKLNKWLLPNFTKQRLELSKAKKWQLALLAWKAFVTKNYLDA